MKLDLDALRTAVHAVDPGATSNPWASSDKMIRVQQSAQLGTATIDISLHRRSPSIECRFVRTRTDRALLRAVIDEFDRQALA